MDFIAVQIEITCFLHGLELLIIIRQEEGEQFKAYSYKAPNTVPVYQFYSANDRDHYYSTYQEHHGIIPMKE